MKALSGPELISLCDWLNESLAHAQLQDLWTDEGHLVLQFYRNGESFVVFRLDPQVPLVWMQKQKPRVKKSPKPVGLFLASHGRNKILGEVKVLREKGRCLLWTLQARGEICEIEMDVIPKSPNLTARAVGKEVRWNKPRELPAPVWPVEEVPIRDWAIWSLEQAAPSKVEVTRAGAQPVKISSRDRAIQKKEKALLAMQDQLNLNLELRYRALGQALKISDEVPPELRNLYDTEKSVAHNRERVFQKAKDLERKKQGTRDRMIIVQRELEKLRQAPAQLSVTAVKPQMTAAVKAMRKGEAQGRKLKLDQGFEAVIGKSGGDNLAILRQARAWDFWIHLKDEPGAHAILFRNRDQEVPSSVIEQVANWVWAESRGKKALLGQGKYEVLVVECRFVKPIKGDKLGRVNYQNPRVYTFASKGGS